MWVLFGCDFTFSSFYILYLHNKTCVASKNLQWSIKRNQSSFDLVTYGYLKYMFVDFIAYCYISRSSSDVLIIEYGAVNKKWRRSPNSFKCDGHGVYGVSSLFLTYSSIGVQLNKSTCIIHIIPAYHMYAINHMFLCLTRNLELWNCKSPMCWIWSLTCQTINPYFSGSKSYRPFHIC